MKIHGGWCVPLLGVACGEPPPAATPVRPPLPVVPAVVAAPAPPPTHPPDVVLITADGLRPDHLPTAGYPRDTAPSLAALAAAGATLTRAYAASSWEAPALASLSTGLYPNQHGIDRGAYDGATVTGLPELPERHETLTERLGAAGYQTWMVTSSPWLSAAGLHQGATTRWDLGAGPIPDPPADGAPFAADTPAFVWIHLPAPGTGADAVEPWYTPWAAEPPPALRQDAGQRARQADLGPLIARYDSGLRAWDEALAQALRWAPADALVVVTGTCGHALGEHGPVGRRTDLTEEQVRVPLFVRWPGHVQAGARLDTPVSAVDLLPTLVAAATGQAPTDTAGLDLLPLLTGGTAPPDRLILMELRERDGRFRRAGIAGDHKLHWIQGATGDVLRLYDLDTDPEEAQDLSEAQADLAAWMQDAIRAWIAGATTIAPGKTLTYRWPAAVSREPAR